MTVFFSLICLLLLLFHIIKSSPEDKADSNTISLESLRGLNLEFEKLWAIYHD